MQYIVPALRQDCSESKTTGKPPQNTAMDAPLSSARHNQEPQDEKRREKERKHRDRSRSRSRRRRARPRSRRPRRGRRSRRLPDSGRRCPRSRPEKPLSRSSPPRCNHTTLSFLSVTPVPGDLTRGRDTASPIRRPARADRGGDAFGSEHSNKASRHSARPLTIATHLSRYIFETSCSS